MKILLAIDGSEHSARTVDAMGSHPWPVGSTVRVLSVVDQVVTAVPEVAVFSAETTGTGGRSDSTATEIRRCLGTWSEPPVPRWSVSAGEGGGIVKVAKL